MNKAEEQWGWFLTSTWGSHTHVHIYASTPMHSCVHTYMNMHRHMNTIQKWRKQNNRNYREYGYIWVIATHTWASIYTCILYKHECENKGNKTTGTIHSMVVFISQCNWILKIKLGMVIHACNLRTWNTFLMQENQKFEVNPNYVLRPFLTHTGKISRTKLERWLSS